MKSLSALLRGITSNHNGDFYCLNCFHTYSTKEKLEKHGILCNYHDYCYIEIPNDNNKILKCNHGEKSMRVPFVIYPDLEFLCKMHSYQNNPEKSYTEKIIKHAYFGYSLFTNCSFDERKNKLDCFKDEDCMGRFCKDLREHAMKIMNFEEKEVILLTNENKFYKKKKVCYICIKEFSIDENDKNKFKLYDKFRDHCHYTGKFRGGAHSICNLRYKSPKEILVVFHNGYTYDAISVRTVNLNLIICQSKRIN